MKLVYSQTDHPLAEGHTRRNPRFFQSVEPDVTAVAIVGNFPLIADAYREAGIPVHEADKGEPEPEAPKADAPPRSDVEIPSNWADLTWPERKHLAQQLTTETIINGGKAAEAIEAELARREFDKA